MMSGYGNNNIPVLTKSSFRGDGGLPGLFIRPAIHWWVLSVGSRDPFAVGIPGVRSCKVQAGDNDSTCRPYRVNV